MRKIIARRLEDIKTSAVFNVLCGDEQPSV
jgi:hypothetical protein